MTHAASALSLALDPARAAGQLLASVRDQLGHANPPDLGLLIGTAAHGPMLEAAATELADALPDTTLVGASFEGVIAAGSECLGQPALALLCLSHDGPGPRPRVTPFLLDPTAGREQRVGGEIESLFLRPPTANDLVVLLPDALTTDLGKLLPALSEALAPAVVVGGGASGPDHEACLAWMDGEVLHGGLAGLVIEGARPPRLAITQACRPLGEPVRVTGSRGHWVETIEGRPALDWFRDHAGRALAEDLPRAARTLVVAVDGERIAAPLRAHHVSGFDPAAGSFALSEPVQRGQALRFAFLDRDYARHSLRDALDGIDHVGAEAGLYFGCRSRGAGLFGHAGLEAALLEERLAPRPLLGAAGPFQIASDRPDRIVQLGFSGVIALLD